MAPAYVLDFILSQGEHLAQFLKAEFGLWWGMAAFAGLLLFAIVCIFWILGAMWRGLFGRRTAVIVVNTTTTATPTPEKKKEEAKTSPLITVLMWLGLILVLLYYGPRMLYHVTGPVPLTIEERDAARAAKKGIVWNGEFDLQPAGKVGASSDIFELEPNRHPFIGPGNPVLNVDFRAICWNKSTDGVQGHYANPHNCDQADPGRADEAFSVVNLRPWVWHAHIGTND